VRQGSVRNRGFAWALCALAVQGGLAQGSLGSQAAKNWAWDQVKAWTFSKRDARGQTLWDNRKFLNLDYPEQTAQLLERLNGDALSRRAALILLGQRPLDQWARAALRKAEDRDEVAQYLYAKGYRYPDKDPFIYLEPSSRVDRPWTQGLGLHLDGPNTWRFQWISSPVLLPRLDAVGPLPRALEQAAEPSVLLHLKQLRPGLARLQTLAGGEEGMVPALAHGSRAGFFVKHLEVWLKQSSPVLEPLASREAWVLHYGVSRGEQGPAEGTLLFLPGELPTRIKLALELLKLNPTSLGPRSKSLTWTGPYGGKVEVTQVRGSGGVLSLCATADGTWICDREAPLRAVLFPVADVTLAERSEWCKVALAGMRAQTEVSLWLLPRLGAGAAFERAALRRRLLGSLQNTWNNPSIAKAAPRTGTLAVALGAGPTELLVNAMLRKDQEAPIEDPELPVIAEGGQNLTPEQRAAYQADLQLAKSRREARKVMRDEASSLLAFLDLRGAALYWKGWVAPPALSTAEKAALLEFRKLQKESSYQASQLQSQGKVDFYGGFGEPGMTPSVAVALPIQAGKGANLEASVKKLWPRLFRGKLENREYAKGVLLNRIRTEQAFTPCYAIVTDTLVVGSDDAAVQAVVSGLLGQTTTVADFQSKAYGIAQIDGASAARDLEALLLAYLRVNQGGHYWWFGEPAPSDDEATAEVASTFGPFLGAVKALGNRTLELEWTSGGLEARPK
jgi:hypothetical protein